MANKTFLFFFLKCLQKQKNKIDIEINARLFFHFVLKFGQKHMSCFLTYKQCIWSFSIKLVFKLSDF